MRNLNMRTLVKLAFTSVLALSAASAFAQTALVAMDARGRAVGRIAGGENFTWLYTTVRGISTAIPLTTPAMDSYLNSIQRPSLSMGPQIGDPYNYSSYFVPGAPRQPFSYTSTNCTGTPYSVIPGPGVLPSFYYNFNGVEYLMTATSMYATRLTFNSRGWPKTFPANAQECRQVTHTAHGTPMSGPDNISGMFALPFTIR